MLARIIIAFASLTAIAAGDCTTAPFGNCGSDSAGCIDLPAQCTQQYPGVDFNGNDLQTVYGLQPGECCTKCTQTSGCKAYTFVNSNPGQTACYLKSGTGTQTPSTGAVSGIVATNSPTPTPTPTATSGPTTAPTPTPTSSSPTCSTPTYGSCGSSTGTTCCPSGYYCQPWNDTFYQCIQPPSQCTKQQTDTDYYGNDLQTVYVSLPSLCCDACASTTGCKAYTYINNNPGQPVCYLKSAVGTASTKIGAVSGTLN
ncbi:hypothetical protein JM18_006220 [Phytophthora kernoviae]|uniref:Apple domain-containing protein n=2 Tax=Phytophthora kernoviae TaxID=325452 RepID=A0A921V5S6_9STRA|nr:hypothetical protein G195_003936 [Phytophthora kernoviae 00238/432]KAG2521207.1 hypothetical protein JM18_006220 [Phytophthora kernoviae]